MKMWALIFLVFVALAYLVFEPIEQRTWQKRLKRFVRGVEAPVSSLIIGIIGLVSFTYGLTQASGWKKFVALALIALAFWVTGKSLQMLRKMLHEMRTR